MKPTKEQLADPKWWDENAKPEDNYCYKWVITGECFFSRDFDDSIDDDYQQLAKRPQAKWVPEVGEWCLGHTTDAAQNWSWQKVQPIKDMERGEFACYTEKKVLRFVDQFKPIKTQREELVDIFNKTKSKDGLGILESCAYAVLAKYELTEKDGE